MRIRHIAYGMATFLPGVQALRSRLQPGVMKEHTDSARYCYSVWLRHLVRASENGLNVWPEAVAELGPGSSLGVGLAALITGSSRYYGLEIVDRAGVEKNVEVFDELVELFTRREDIPAPDEFPRVKPMLENYDFPAHVLDGDRMLAALDGSRLESIRDSITTGGGMIEYRAPWHEADVIEKRSVDMIYSQAVLEHVDDLSSTYRAMALWLKPGGYVSHVIDFKSHGLSAAWDGHRACSDFVWRLVRGRRPYLLNRAPMSEHLDMLELHGFEARCREPYESEPTVSAEKLAPRFRGMTEEDRACASVFIQASRDG